MAILVLQWPSLGWAGYPMLPHSRLAASSRRETGRIKGPSNRWQHWQQDGRAGCRAGAGKNKLQGASCGWAVRAAPYRALTDSAWPRSGGDEEAARQEQPHQRQSDLFRHQTARVAEVAESLKASSLTVAPRKNSAVLFIHHCSSPGSETGSKHDRKLSIHIHSTVFMSELAKQILRLFIFPAV